MVDLQTLGNIQAQIQTGIMLVNLGLTTVEKLKELFTKDGHDDETLAQIMSEVDRRIERRS